MFDASELYWGDPDPNQPQSSPWQNSLNRFDVNGDQETTASTSLRVINALPEFAGGVLPQNGPTDSPHAYVDVNGDGLVTALDVLLVINQLPKLDQPGSEAASVRCCRSAV